MNGGSYEKGRAWIELEMDNLRRNVRFFQKLLPKRCALMPAVKANAYGHGAVRIAEELQRLGVHNYCAASAAEGVQLRRAGIGGQILILGYTHPRDFEALRAYRLTQTVVDAAYGRELEASGGELSVHVGVDTGMHRLGIPYDNRPELLRLWDYKNLRITGVYSHLCTSDGTTREERAYMRLQEARFLKTVEYLRAEGKSGFAAHLHGSYGLLNRPEGGGSYDYARVGIALYGVHSSPSSELEQRFDLRPVLSLKARIVCVRALEEGEGAGYGLAWRAPSRRRIAAVSIGYADGFPRALSNRGHALVRGRRAPVVGNICMDQLLLDVTDIPEAQPGDEAVLIGESGKQKIRVEELAKETGTISNEILSRLGERLFRMEAG